MLIRFVGTDAVSLFFASPQPVCISSVSTPVNAYIWCFWVIVLDPNGCLYASCHSSVVSGIDVCIASASVYRIDVCVASAFVYHIDVCIASAFVYRIDVCIASAFVYRIDVCIASAFGYRIDV
jgi:hypothetical protein